MKAAVLHEIGAIPVCEDFPDPVPGDNELIVEVKAVAIENVDRAMVSGKHFATGQFLSTLPAIIGFDGIGMVGGRLVGFGGMRAPYGAMAEKTVIPAQYQVPVPDGVDAVTAAALPASALTSLFPLKWGAKLQPGETVLVNGATGVSGRLAVQIAKLLGAGRVIGTGRDADSLRALPGLGVDVVIDLKQSEADLQAAFAAAVEPGCDVILDFLWGRPTELLIQALVPRELRFAQRKIRLIQIGEMAGAKLDLPADALRTSGLEIYGGGAGITPEAMGEGTALVWEYIKGGKLKIDIEAVPLKDIESAWQREVHGKRLVIVP